jgi:carbon monoxide dehydrogenase subunit G
VELTHEFTVPASIDDAWATFNDLERVAPCFPGASLTSFDGENFEGLVKVKLGPVSLLYTGTGRFVERDEAAHRAVIEAKGKDKRGNGTAAANVTASLESAGDATTKVTVSTDLSITGKPAQFGRGVIQDVSDKLLRQFSGCLETKLGQSAEEAAAEADAAAAAAVAGQAGSSAPVSDPQGRPARTDDAGARHRAETTATRLASASVSTPEGPAAALDVGVTVLPVLLRRYAPQIIAGLIALLIIRKLLRRR